MMDSDSSRPVKKTLAILSGSRVAVWNLPEYSTVDKNGAVDAESEDPDIRLFDPYPQYEDGVPISSIAWNHNQMVIATSSGIPTEEFPHDNIVLLSSQGGQKLDAFQHDSEWKQKQQYAQQQESGHQGSIVNSINFGGKSRYLCIGDENGAVCLWDLKKKVRVRQFFHKKLASTGASAGNININGNIVSSPSLQVSLDPTDTYVISLSPWAMYQYNLRDGQLVGILEVPKDDEDSSSNNTNMFNAFAISDIEHNICAIGTDGGSIYLHDISTRNGRTQAKTPYSRIIRRHAGAVTGLSFSPGNPNLLLSSGTDGVVFVHNKSNGTSHKVCEALDRNNPIESFSLHADGVTCAIGCRSGDIYVYDLRWIINGGEIQATLLASYRAYDAINSLFFAPPPKPKDPQRLRSGIQSENNTKNESTQQQLQLQQQQQPPPQQQPPQLQPPQLQPPQQQPPQQPPAQQQPPQQQAVSATSAKPQRTTATQVESKDKKTNMDLKISSFSPPSQPKTTTPTVATAPPKKVPSFLKAKNSSRIQELPPPSPKSKKNMTEEIREVVREEVENLQDEMEEQFRNLHVDMINQFHHQSREIESILAQHMEALQRLTAENQQLREENERLRSGL
eukprot:jgi/Psemu1/318437/estExt_fgenesh1_pm.C_740017